MSLVALPPELWAIISEYEDVSGADLLNVWQCGCKLLALKLQYGCTRLHLEERRLNAKPKKWPAAVALFTQLHRLTMECPKLDLPLLALSVAAPMPKLQSLRLNCANLNRALSGFDFAWHFPCLQTLGLRDDEGRLPNYLRTLPSTLTRLESTPICGLAVLDTAHAKRLPPQLQYLSYGTRLKFKDAWYVEAKPAVLKHLPATIVSFQRPNDLIRLQNVAALNDLPPNLTALNVTLTCLTSAPLALMRPSTLTRLKVLAPNSPYEPLLRTFWSVMASLGHLQDLEVDIRYMDNAYEFDAAEWQNMLPPQLVRFKTSSRVPIKRETGVLIWPAGLTALEMPAPSLDDGFFEQTQMQTVQSWGLSGLCKLRRLTFSPHRDMYPLLDFAFLPTSLTSVTIYVDTAYKPQFDLSRLTQLVSLTLEVYRAESLLQAGWIKLPATLRHVNSFGHAGKDMTSQFAYMLVLALPQTLDSLSVEWCYLPVQSVKDRCHALALAQQLPRALKRLHLPLVLDMNDGGDGLIKLIEALPPRLESLTITPVAIIPTAAEVLYEHGADIHMSALPSALRELRVFPPYVFRPESFDRCMPSMRHIKITTDQHVTSDVITRAFPNLESE
jgi:hypothetical protein